MLAALLLVGFFVNLPLVHSPEKAAELRQQIQTEHMEFQLLAEDQDKNGWLDPELQLWEWQNPGPYLAAVTNYNENPSDLQTLEEWLPLLHAAAQKEVFVRPRSSPSDYSLDTLEPGRMYTLRALSLYSEELMRDKRWSEAIKVQCARARLARKWEGTPGLSPFLDSLTATKDLWDFCLHHFTPKLRLSEEDWRNLAKTCTEVTPSSQEIKRAIQFNLVVWWAEKSASSSQPATWLGTILDIQKKRELRLIQNLLVKLEEAKTFEEIRAKWNLATENGWSSYLAGRSSSFPGSYIVQSRTINDAALRAQFRLAVLHTYASLRAHRASHDSYPSDLSEVGNLGRSSFPEIDWNTDIKYDPKTLELKCRLSEDGGTHLQRRMDGVGAEDGVVVLSLREPSL